MNILNDSVTYIIESLKTDPQKWECSEYRLQHMNGISIWIANGFFFLSIDTPFQKKFNIIDKIYLWVAIKIWMTTKVQNILKT